MSIIAALTLFACSDKKKETETALPKTDIASTLGDAEWLIGTWQDLSEEGTLTETWTATADSSFTGKTTFVAGKDTVFSETIQLAQRNGNLVYIVTAKGQNDEKPVEFPLISVSEKQMVFENPRHDYPTKIVYENYGDSLKAWISGKKMGVEMKEEFPMKRVK